MSVTQELLERGGLATRADLLTTVDRLTLDAALAAGEVVADGRGRYALPSVDDGLRRAHALSGVLCLASAALHHGWEVLRVPEQPLVTVPRRRRVVESRREGVQLRWRDLHKDDLVDGKRGLVTTREATLRDCLRLLPWDEALAVADSALRHGVTPATLKRVALSAHGPGGRQVRRVAGAASGQAANPFESGLRSVALDVEGLHVRPQVRVRLPERTVQPDLVDEDLMIAVEADSFEWHGGRADLEADAHRYNLLVVGGWLVLRFAWEDVMFDQPYVAAVLRAAVQQRTYRQPRAGCPA